MKQMFEMFFCFLSYETNLLQKYVIFHIGLLSSIEVIFLKYDFKLI